MGMNFLQVALGGAAGAVCRYAAGLWVARMLGNGFPWGTLAVNVLGSCLMGVLVVMLTQVTGNRFAPLVLTGFLGGFTTFSAFSLDAVNLFERGQPELAVGYVAASVLLSIAALFVGLAVARSLLT